MSNSTKIHADSKVFGKISPAIFQAVLDVMPALGVVLNWEPLACVFLADVLRQISLMGNPLRLSHVEFASVLWGKDITKVAAERRMGRCVHALTRCQAMSGCLAVWIERGGRVERGGKVEYLKTSYRLRDFFVIFGEIQALVVEQDLMALPMRERKYTQLAIIQSVCDAREYQKMPKRMRQPRHFQEAKVKAEPEPKVEPSPPSMLTYSKALEWYRGQLRAHLLSLGKVDRGFNAVIEEAQRVIRLEERAALDAILRPKGVSR